MTISDFRNAELAQDDPPAGRPARRRYRAVKRDEAQQRQEVFDGEVDDYTDDHHVTSDEARRVVRARRRHERQGNSRLHIEVHVDPDAFAAEVARATATAVRRRRGAR